MRSQGRMDFDWRIELSVSRDAQQVINVSKIVCRLILRLPLADFVLHGLRPSICELSLFQCNRIYARHVMTSDESIHAAHINEVHMVPIDVIIRPIPPVLDEDKVLSLMDTIAAVRSLRFDQFPLQCHDSRDVGAGTSTAAWDRSRGCCPSAPVI